jgi:hypothetical protein
VADDPAFRAALLGAVWCAREAAAFAAGHVSDPDGTFLGALVGLTLRDPCPFVRSAAAGVAGPACATWWTRGAGRSGAGTTTAE